MKKLLFTTCIIFASSISYSENEKNVLWNKDRSAVAFCVSENESLCFIVSGEMVANVSQVENGNIGKLGITPKSKYEKVITFPTKWLQSNNNEFMISFTTQAWLSGQRYTVTEPVLVKNGKYWER